MIPTLLATLAATAVAVLTIGPLASARAVLGRPATVRPGVGLVTDPTHRRPPRVWTVWAMGWRRAAGSAGFAASTNQILSAATVWPSVGLALGLMVTGSVQFSLFVAVLPLGLGWMWLDGRGKRRALVVEGQLAGFLTAFLMHAESGLEPANALLRAVESVPPQLRAVLSPMTNAISANVPPAVALADLKASTSNPVIGEMCTNVRIAMRSGTGLSQQLAMLADHVRVAAETRSEAARELMSPRLMASMVVCMGPLTYLAIMAGMPDWHAQWSADLIGQAVLTTAFALNTVGAVLLYRTLRKADRA